MCKYLAQNNNPAVTPQPTELPDGPVLQIKAFSLHHVCPQVQVESMFCEEFPEFFSIFTQNTPQNNELQPFVWWLNVGT